MAEPLWPHIEVIESELLRARSLWLGLDFDGTLAPVVSTPEGASLGEEVRNTLAALSREECMDVAIISGRDLSDIRSKVNLKGITFAGNHGMQIVGSGITFEDTVAHALRPTIDKVEFILRERLRAIPGALIEHKGLSISVHYRLADPDDMPRIESAITELVDAYPAIRTRLGVKVIEILPVASAHKGVAVRKLLEMRADREPLPIYLGDDVTDEDAFKAIPEGLTIRVGESADTCARYHVASPLAVHQFLKWLATHLSNR